MGEHTFSGSTPAESVLPNGTGTMDRHRAGGTDAGAEFENIEIYDVLP